MAIEFLDDLVLKDCGDGVLWEVVEPFAWSDGCEVIEVPAGYKTDLASVPRVFWVLFPRHGKYTKSAVIHDYLYSEGIGTKKDADRLFYENMLAQGVNRARAWLMYQAVKIGGKGNFK